MVPAFSCNGVKSLSFSMRWYPPLLLLLLLSFLLAPLLSCRTASFHPPTHGPERFSRWNQTPTIGSRCIERSMTSLNFPWRHATGSQLSFGNNRAVSLRVIDQAVGSLFDACSDSTHAMIYKLHRNETIESRWNRPIVLKRVYENGWAPFNEGINFTRWERCHWDY